MSTTWLDHLPVEIVFQIFRYLSSNDIVYAFAHFSERFQRILITNSENYLKLYLPTNNFKEWEIICSIIGSYIEFIEIDTCDVFFPLSNFPNLKSLVLSSSCKLVDEQLKLIIENKQFNKLQSFELFKQKLFVNETDRDNTTSHNYLLQKIWNYQNSLGIVHYSALIPTFSVLNLNNLQSNQNLHSLTIILNELNDIFTLLSYTPNLNYLNLQSYPPKVFQTTNYEKKHKLKEFHLKLNNKWNRSIDFNQLIDVIHQISSILVCLSLNFATSFLDHTKGSLIDHSKLEQFFETMNELKEFHLYVKLPRQNEQSIKIFSNFQKQFWSNRNLSFGMYGNYLYTVPFYFDYLHEVDQNFHRNHQLDVWSNVRYIELSVASNSNGNNIIQELKLKIPKLIIILWRNYSDSNFNYNEKKNTMINHINIIHSSFRDSLIYSNEDWYVFTLLECTHLFLRNEDAFSATARVKLRLNSIHYIGLVRLSKLHQFCLFNVPHVDFSIDRKRASLQWYAHILTKFIKSFQSLETIKIFIEDSLSSNEKNSNTETELIELIVYLNMNDEILNNFKLKYYSDYFLLKRINLYT